MARPRTVQRFDRTVDVLCRRGFVSLLTQGWVDRDAQAAMGRLHAFGRLIGNSDMLQGNLGFHLVDSGPLPLAPAYDMLPMSLAPSRTGGAACGYAARLHRAGAQRPARAPALGSAAGGGLLAACGGFGAAALRRAA